METSRLASISLFDGLAEDELANLASRFQEEQLLAGSSLAKQNDFSYKFFVVLDGEVEIYRDFEHVADLGAGDFFGEMGLISGDRRNARVTAKTRCELAWMMSWDFQEMQNNHAMVCDRIEAAIAERSPSSD